MPKNDGIPRKKSLWERTPHKTGYVMIAVFGAVLFVLPFVNIFMHFTAYRVALIVASGVVGICYFNGVTASRLAAFPMLLLNGISYVLAVTAHAMESAWRASRYLDLFDIIESFSLPSLLFLIFYLLFLVYLIYIAIMNESTAAFYKAQNNRVSGRPIDVEESELRLPND